MSTSVGIQLNPSHRPGVVLALDPLDRERLRVRPRLGLGRLVFAVLLLAAGAYGQLETWRDSAWVSFVFATLLAWGGVALVALRRCVVLDRREGVVEHWRGLLLRHFQHRAPLAHFDRVRVTLGSEGGSGGTTTTYPVRLEGRDQPLELDAPGYWEPARQLAEEVAAFLRLPIHDEDRSGKLQPDELDRTVGRRGRHVNPVAEPKQLACRIGEQRDDLLRVRIPPPAYQPFLALSVIVGLFFMIPLTIELFVPLLRGRPVGWAVALPLFLPLWVFYESARAVLTNGGLLEVTPGTFRMAVRRPWGARVVAIPASELEDLVILDPELGGPRSLMAYFAPAVLVARSDRESVRFGYGLSRDELVWLRSKIARLLGGRENPTPRPKRHALASRWMGSLAGLGLGMLAAHLTRGFLTPCLAVPFVQHVVSVGASLGLAVGLLWDRRRGHRSLGPAVIAVLVALLLTSGWRERHDLVQQRPFLQEFRGFQNSFAHHETRKAQQRFLVGFWPMAALINLAGLELALALGERWQRRRKRLDRHRTPRPRGSG